MIVISKDEAKMLRKKFPGVHMVTTVNKTMVDELPFVLEALPNNYFAQEALAEINSLTKTKSSVIGEACGETRKPGWLA